MSDAPPPGWGGAPPPPPPPGHGQGPYPANYGQQPPPPPYGYQPYGPMGGVAAEHPQGTTILVLGILGLVLALGCGVGFILGAIAWSMGGKALREIDADTTATYVNRGTVNAGRICGMIATIIGAVWLVAVILAAVASATL